MVVLHMAEKEQSKRIAWPTVVRLSEYLIILEELQANGVQVVSSRELAELYGNNANQVRQDFFCLSNFGRVGQGYEVSALESTIRDALGLQETRRIAIVGCGRLGTTLALHVPLERYGMQLAAAFDVSPTVVGRTLGSLTIHHADDTEAVCREENIQLAALSVPKDVAQASAEQLVRGGVVGILNYSRVRLRVPPRIVVQNRQIICSFMQLAHAVSVGG